MGCKSCDPYVPTSVTAYYFGKPFFYFFADMEYSISVISNNTFSVFRGLVLFSSSLIASPVSRDLHVWDSSSHFESDILSDQKLRDIIYFLGF